MAYYFLATTVVSEATPQHKSVLPHQNEATPVSESSQFLTFSYYVNEREQSNAASAANRDTDDADDSVERVQRALASEHTSILASCQGDDAGFLRESIDCGTASNSDILRVLQRLESKVDILLEALYADGLETQDQSFQASKVKNSSRWSKLELVKTGYRHCHQCHKKD